MSLSVCPPETSSQRPAAAPPVAPSRNDQSTDPASLVSLRPFMLVALYAIPIVVALRPAAEPITDPDIWWHLRVGQWVSEHGAVPATDPFSAYGHEKPWVAYSWLFEVLVYRLYQTFGLAGILVYRAALSLAVVAALHRLVHRREPRFLVVVELLTAAVLALAPMFTERPWLFTVLFAILTLDVVLDLRAGRSSRWVWLLPGVFVLWTNLHIQFIYGLLLLGLGCAAPAIDSWLARRRGETAGPPFSRPMFLLTAACVLATLLNPYHVRVYGVVLEYATQPAPFRCINELRALEFREPPDWVMLALGAAAVFVLGRRSRLSSFEILLLAGAGLLAFRSRRDLWMLIVAAMAILSKPKSGIASPPCIGSSRGRWAAALTLFLLLIGFLAWRRDLSPEGLRRKVASVYPVEAASVVSTRGDKGPLFNDFNWGGFLIWSLPQFPVALDGRTNLHGDERILRSINTWTAGPRWRDDPDLAAAGVVVADVNSPLGCVLVLDDRFELVHEDAVARVFVKKPTRTSPVKGRDDLTNCIR